jgi:VWFA-related protein
VSVVNVDVYVTDRSGNPVHGLTKDDFVLSEDGRRVEVTNFFAAEGGAIEGELPPLPGTPAAAAAEAAAREVPDDQRLHLAIYFDNYNLTPQARALALKSLREFIEKRVTAHDRILLVSYDGPGTFNVRQAPTRDAYVLLESLNQIGETAAGVSRRMTREQLRRDIEVAENTGDPQLLGGLERESQRADFNNYDADGLYDRIVLYAQREYEEIRRTTEALGQFVDSLAGLPGRKALVYVSSGVSLRPGQALFELWADRYEGLYQRDTSVRSTAGARLEGMNVDATPLFERLGARANASRVTLYAMGAPEDVPERSAQSRGNAYDWQPQIQTESQNQNDSLILLAGSTGGIATSLDASPEALLANLRRDLDSYYSLGYTPAQRKTGKDRKLKVELRDQQRYRLRYRESFRDRTVQERMGEQTLAALLLDSAENPLGVALEFEQEAKKGKELHLTLLVKFPMSALVLLPQEKFHEGRVTLFVGARDGKGRVSDLTQIAIPVRVPNEQVLAAMGQTVAYRTSLTLRPESHVVAVGMRDEIGNQGSTVTAAYSPGQAPTAMSSARPAAPERGER